MTNPSPPAVAYLGLGAMGAPIAANLLRAGFPLTIWNRTPEKCAALAARGARVAGTLEEMARSGSELFFLNLSHGRAVSEVLFGEGGLARALPRGVVVIDNSTIGPEEARDVAAKLDVLGVAFLDAPVSGGRAGAEQGTLSIMVGGAPEVFARCRPVLETIGRTIAHLGPAGMGQAAKACNQVAVACNLVGVCEALALARQLGVDAPKLLELLAGGGAASRQLQNYGARILRGDLAPGFAVDLMLKDLGIAQNAAAAAGLALGGTDVAASYLRQVAAAGGGALGTQAMSRALEQRGNFQFVDPA